MSRLSPTSLLLNVGHALDHLFLLIFATAVGAIAQQWGMLWEDLMPYAAGAFVMFGVGSLPAGRLGDLWGRRAMMIVYFLGMGLSALFIAMASGPRHLAVALTVMGIFASIYHPVGIPMLVQNAKKPGFTIGVNGLAGNLGIAVAAILTGFLVKTMGWRAAFIGPGGVALACGALFALLVPREESPPARRPKKAVDLPQAVIVRAFAVMTMAAIMGALLFNFTTNGNGQLMAERLRGTVDNPVTLGALLALVYTVASFAQLVVVKLLVRFPLKRIWFPMAAANVPLFILAALRAAAGHHGAGLRRDSLHRRAHRPVRGRPHALARGRHAAGRVVRRQLPRRLPARPHREGGRFHHAAAGHGRAGRADRLLRRAPARPVGGGDSIRAGGGGLCPLGGRVARSRKAPQEGG